MSDLESRLALYPELRPEERHALAAEVTEQRPDLLPALQEVRTLAAVLDAHGAHPPLTPSALGHLAAREHVAGERPPDSVREHLQRDADARSAYYTLRDRVEALDASLPDPFAQFNALTGHRLEASPPRATIHRLHAPRRAAVPRAAPRAGMLRYAAAACFGLVALYGALSIASRASVSELDRLGRLDVEELQEAAGAGAVRGEAAGSAATAQAQYLRALDRVEAARGSTLGLFPRYDAAALREAQRLLEGVVAREEPGSFLHLEASFALGKTLLLLGDEEQARLALLRVVEYGGRKAEDAARILATLEARAG